MLTIKQTGIIAAHSAMAGAVGFAVVASFTKILSTVSSLAAGSLGALISSGNLALFYAVGAFGEARSMTDWKVRLLQAGAMGLYDVAVLITGIALGIINPVTVIGISVLCVGWITVLGPLDAWYQFNINPDRIYSDLMPPSVFSLPPRFVLEYAEYREPVEEIFLQLSYIRSLEEPFRHDALECFFHRHPNRSTHNFRAYVMHYVNNEIDQPGNEVNYKHRPEINVKLGRCLLHHMKEAKALLLKPETPGIRHYTQEDIANLEGDSFWSITVMGIYSMIANSVYDQDKHLFTLKGTGEEQLVLGPDQDVLELRNKMIELHTSTQTLSNEAKTLLTLKLTRADTKLEEAAAEKVNNSKQLEQMQLVFNAITALKGEFDRHLISTHGYAPEPTLNWSQVFA